MTVTPQRGEAPPDAFQQAEETARFILSRTFLRPTVAVVLGSGLGAFADDMTEAVKIGYGDIPHFSRSTAVGHAGQLVIGKIGNCPIATMQGRVHLYEGHTAQKVAFPIRVLGRLGVRAVILTNAAGGINLDYSQGGLVIIRDHINLLGGNPLVGEEDVRFGPRFIDMTEAYAKDYRKIALDAARELGIQTAEGVYAAVLGPSYETPAEIRYLRAIGADLVGMSTIPEVIAARQMKMKVLAISCVTNMAAGVLDKPLDHAEVLETGRRVAGQFKALLQAVIPNIAKDVG
jgi:purine-nucleoside phosphorylase